ncbi:hypothetical protein TUM20985_20960 [Mycobacterium antarcticum]|nr:hypothetical protein TUM20985_20960 [Mycolicibacterium sp. TUM20985]
MSRSIWTGATDKLRRVRACTFESMPLETDPKILSAVHEVYTTDLGLPDDWTAPQRAEFIADEAEKITWMVWAEAGTTGERSIQDWTRRSGGRAPDRAVRGTLMAEARIQAITYVLNTELYEQITTDA